MELALLSVSSAARIHPCENPAGCFCLRYAFFKLSILELEGVTEWHCMEQDAGWEQQDSLLAPSPPAALLLGSSGAPAEPHRIAEAAPTDFFIFFFWKDNQDFEG